MDNSIIIFCPGEIAEEVKSAIMEKFPKSGIRIFTDEEQSEEIAQKIVDKVFKKLDETDFPIPVNPRVKSFNPYDNQLPVAMYGCIQTDFHSIPQADDIILELNTDTNEH